MTKRFSLPRLAERARRRHACRTHFPLASSYFPSLWDWYCWCQHSDITGLPVLEASIELSGR